MTIPEEAIDAGRQAVKDVYGVYGLSEGAMRVALEGALPHVQGQLLGYVIANVDAKRPAYLPHTSVMTERADAEHEAHSYQRNRGERYLVCEVRPALDPFTPLPEIDPSPEGEPQ